MSAITSKAIVITAYAGKHGTITAAVPARSAEFTIVDSVDFDSDDSSNSGAGPPKKRRRLTHLSPDEKLLRRKLKNRVAAQTARDRKKALMAELEEKVSKLEEENKVLKRQNFTLKEASTTLAKENAVLKSQLADHPVATIKTDSETLRSAAPAVPPQKEQFQILSRWVAQYFTFVVTLRLAHLMMKPERTNYEPFLTEINETASILLNPDDFLGLLQEFTENSKCKQSQAETTTPFTSDISGGDCIDNSIRSNHRASSSRVVGLSPAELESLNELISIDHIYVKSQPVASHKGKEGQHRSHAPVRIHGQSASTASSQQKFSNGSIVASKRKHPSEVKCQTVSLLQPVYSSHHLGSEVPALNHDFALSSHLPSHPLSSLQTSIPADIADEFLSSFSDSDVESSLSLFQDLDFSVIESNLETGPAVDLTTDSKANICMDIKCDASTAEEVSESELNTSKLFDEIYEHYLNIGSSSPDPTSSDSGISSDLDAMSPGSIEDSFHDDMWHDTSFADLFPDLQ